MIRSCNINPELKSLWWRYLSSIAFFEDACSVMLLGHLGIKEDKLGPHFNKDKNLKFVKELEEIEERTLADEMHKSQMKQCLQDDYYLTDSHNRDFFEKRSPDCKVNIDRLEKVLDSDSSDSEELSKASINKLLPKDSKSPDLSPVNLRPVASLPVKSLRTPITNHHQQEKGAWKSVARHVMAVGSTFEEVKKARLTMNAEILLAKINAMKKAAEKESSDSEEEPISEVRYTSQKKTSVQQGSPEESRFQKPADKSYVARLGFLFHLVFSRAQEQFWAVEKRELGSPLKLKKSNSKVGRENTEPKNKTSLPQIPSQKSNKGRSLIKGGVKPKVRQEKLTREEIDAIRNKIIGGRIIYNQNSVKTEEAAQIERYINNKIFSELGVLDKEYLSLGAANFLK